MSAILDDEICIEEFDIDDLRVYKINTDFNVKLRHELHDIDANLSKKDLSLESTMTETEFTTKLSRMENDCKIKEFILSIPMSANIELTMFIINLKLYNIIDDDMYHKFYKNTLKYTPSFREFISERYLLTR